MSSRDDPELLASFLCCLLFSGKAIENVAHARWEMRTRSSFLQSATPSHRNIFPPRLRLQAFCVSGGPCDLPTPAAPYFPDPQRTLTPFPRSSVDPGSGLGWESSTSVVAGVQPWDARRRLGVVDVRVRLSPAAKSHDFDPGLEKGRSP